MERARVRYTRKGWYAFWLRWHTGTMFFGRVIPDQYGLLYRDTWLGPFPTALGAIDAVNAISTTKHTQGEG